MNGKGYLLHLKIYKKKIEGKNNVLTRETVNNDLSGCTVVFICKET